MSLMNRFNLTPLDQIVTRCIVIMMPVLLLWKVKIKLRQKILIGLFLSLSICMILISFVRIFGLLHYNNFINVKWLLFWHEVEATVATIMVSITAFRELLGIKAL